MMTELEFRKAAHDSGYHDAEIEEMIEIIIDAWKLGAEMDFKDIVLVDRKGNG